MSEEFESGALDPTAAEPRTYGDSQFLESLDPPKADEPLPFSSDHEGIEQAAEERDAAQERHVVDVIQFQDGKGHVQDGDKTASPEYAAEELTNYRARKDALAQAQLDADTQAALDQLDALNAPEQQPQPQQVEQPLEFQPQLETAPPEPTELDNLLQDLPVERRAPFIEAYNQQLVQAQAQAQAQYDQHISQAQASEQQYRQGIVDAAATATASLLVAYPELNGLQTNDQLAGALQTMQRLDPQRHAQLALHVQRVSGTLQAAQQVAQQQAQQQQVAQQQAFKQYVEYHDSKVPAVSNISEVQREIISMAQEHGVSQQELLEAYNTSPVLRHSAFQQMMLDAARYRLAQKAARSAQVRTAPQVQRPGTRSEEAVRESRQSMLEARLRNSRAGISAKDGAAILAARRGY